MKCFDCTDVEMKVDSFEANKDKDVFEVIWTCPRCGEIFLATIYRDTYSKEKGDERGE